MNAGLKLVKSMEVGVLEMFIYANVQKKNINSVKIINEKMATL